MERKTARISKEPEVRRQEILDTAMIMKPEYLWEVEHIFTVDGAGPTGLYLTFLQASGTFFMICSVAAALYILLP